MSGLLHHVFGWVCGQYPGHTWSPGGEPLPLCQRCTGVYVGAFVAALRHLAGRPAPTPRWLWLNGAFLLFMIPSGFYWIPQNPELRCASGILFGFGLVSYLWLPLPNKFTIHDSRLTNRDGQTRANRQSYVITLTSLLAALALTPLLAENGKAVAARILTGTCVAGALMLATLLFANAVIFLRWLGRRYFTKPA